MPGVSIHVVDVSRGVVAAGMAVSLHAIGNGDIRHEVAAGVIGANGVLAHDALGRHFAPGYYVASFAIADYYRNAGVALPPVPFLDIVSYGFGIADPQAHYHLPFKCTPWGYSCFRGGA